VLKKDGALQHGEVDTTRRSGSTSLWERTMLGPPKPRRVDQPITVSLEALVPWDNFYRHLEATLDLSFVRDWVRGCHAESGRPSIDPVVFFTLHLVMFFEGIRSERNLIETASLNLAHRWYLGDALDEELPDHSSLTHIANTPARSVADLSTLSASQSSASSSLDRRDQTRFAPNRRT
jgi:hypothetical protein